MSLALIKTHEGAILPMNLLKIVAYNLINAELALKEMTLPQLVALKGNEILPINMALHKPIMVVDNAIRIEIMETHNKTLMKAEIGNVVMMELIS